MLINVHLYRKCQKVNVIFRLTITINKQQQTTASKQPNLYYTYRVVGTARRTSARALLLLLCAHDASSTDHQGKRRQAYCVALQSDLAIYL